MGDKKKKIAKNVLHTSNRKLTKKNLKVLKEEQWKRTKKNLNKSKFFGFTKR